MELWTKENSKYNDKSIGEIVDTTNDSIVVTCNDSSYDVTKSNCEISWTEYGVYNITVEAKAEGYRSSSSDVVELYISDPSVSTTTVTFVCADGDFVASGTTALIATDDIISVYVMFICLLVYSILS